MACAACDARDLAGAYGLAAIRVRLGVMALGDLFGKLRVLETILEKGFGHGRASV
jgi:hypothetical protein